MKAGIKLAAILVFVLTFILISKGQSEPELATPNQFHGFTLGTALADFSQKNLRDLKNIPSIPFSTIKTTHMTVYTLKNQLTKGGDKIDIDLFFYNDSLAVIRVAYKDRQANKEILEALKAKYGNAARLEDNIYRDPSSRESRIIENMYWEKSACCVLNLTSTDDIGLIYLTFAVKAAQIKLTEEESMDRQKRIN